MKAKSLAVLTLFATLSFPAFAQHGPLRGALSDTNQIAEGFLHAGVAVVKNITPPLAAAGKDIGKNVVRGGKGIVHFCKWLVS